MIRPFTTIVALSVLLIAGCGGQGTGKAETAQSPSPGDTQAALPEGLFLDAAPSEAVPLHEARAKAKAGDSIAFTGYIGGREEPFTEGRALFLVADAIKAPACTDGCKTPWDACCTPGDTIAANSATVQLVDEDGKLLALDLKGRNGLEAGTAVAVVGRVRQADNAVLIVDATGLSVKPMK